MEIVEVIKPKENETISKIEFFEIENLDANNLNNEKEENESKHKPRNKTPLDLEKLVQPLKSKVNPYNIWKDLTTIIGKTYIEVKPNNLGDKETQKEEEPINSLQTTSVNTSNKVKTITFPTTIKLKKTEIKVEAILDTGASKNLLFETLVPKEDQHLNSTCRISAI